MLSKLTIVVLSEYEDGDQVTASYEMPVVVDPVNTDVVAEVVAYHMNRMAADLKTVDRRIHPVQ